MLIRSQHSVLGWGEESCMVVSDQLYGVVTFIDGIDEGLHDEALIGSVLFLRGVGDHVVSLTFGG